MSAQENSPTTYGKQKFAIEKLFSCSQDVIVRPGLVIGNGGLVKEMINFIKKRKVVPLVNGGKQPIQTLYIDDLILAIDKIIEKNLQGSFTIAEPSAITYEKFYRDINYAFNLNAKFISVPYTLFYVAIAFADALKIQLAVSKDSLIGLKNLRVYEVEESLKKLEIEPISFQDSLQRICNTI
jgi:NAD dependent epimerase/dehydratase family enzyme